MNNRITSELLTSLGDGCYLKKFALINHHFNKKQVSLLQEFALNSHYLEELDISYAKVPAASMQDLIVEMAENMTLRNVNFGYTAIFDDSEWCDELVEEHLCRFLRRNKKLAHVDLTKTGLRERHLLQIAGVLRKCRALVAIHLSDNDILPGTVD